MIINAISIVKLSETLRLFRDICTKSHDFQESKFYNHRFFSEISEKFSDKVAKM